MINELERALYKKLDELKDRLNQYANIVNEKIRNNEYSNSFYYAIDMTKELNAQILVVTVLINEL